jgi:aryl-alcohol dehydrogenase-like predicted oxidoreductase
VETIDLYQVHAWDPLTRLEETLRFLSDAVRAGEINYVGLSNFTGWQPQKAVDIAEFRELPSRCRCSRGCPRTAEPADRYGGSPRVWSWVSG